MLIHWLWYAALPGLNEAQKVDLLEHFQDPEDLFFADEKMLSQDENLTKEGIEILLNKNLGTAEETLRECEDQQIQILTYDSKKYPLQLKNIPDPPLVLYYKGRLPDFERLPLIGVVGTRHASAYGLNMAKKMGFQISSCGGIVVSGGATGIDTMAMQGGLMSGSGVIGVLGCGVDVVYPVSNRELYADVLRCGCLISEFPPGTPPYKWNFPKRNRVISGLSCGVLVVEAPKKSGALITARHAREQGRDVFVVTGNAGVETCSGSNDLLRSGAIYADCGWDVMEEYESQYPDVIRHDNTPYHQIQRQDELEKTTARVAQESGFFHKKSPAKKEKRKKVIDNGTKPPYSDVNHAAVSVSEQEKKILTFLRGECLVDELIASSGMTTGEVLAALTLLEIKGVIARLPGRRVCRKESKP